MEKKRKARKSKAKSKQAPRRRRKPVVVAAAVATPSNPDFTTYTIRAIPTTDWVEFKHKLDANGHKVNWVMAELIRRVGNGEIALTK